LWIEWPRTLKATASRSSYPTKTRIIEMPLPC
jgi:hypothetical protein